MVSFYVNSDYYPFGMPMPERRIVDDEQYRYAYQGQEKDPETGKEAFQLRLWDSRIGRWLTTDPYGQYHSPYLGMGNNPILRIDPDGGFEKEWWANVINFLIGGDGVDFDKRKNEYYVIKITTIYEKGTVTYEGKQYEALHEGSFINHIYENPEFYVEGNGFTSIGNQIGVSANLISLNVGGNIYEGRKQLANRQLGWSNKRGLYGSENVHLDGDENGYNIDLLVVSNGATYEGKRGLFNWGEIESEYVGFPVFGEFHQEYDSTHLPTANTIRTRNWGLFGVHLSAIVGFEASVNIGYKY